LKEYYPNQLGQALNFRNFGPVESLVVCQIISDFMFSLGLITEGVSEYRILKRILSVYFKDVSPHIKPLQPNIDETDKQNSPGSWLEVIKWCNNKEYLTEALNRNDYLIIQIDSDVSENKHYDVSKRIGNRSKTDDELYNDIKTKLSILITTEIEELFPLKIIFAICIDSTECWLLPLCYSDNRRNKTSGCLKSLNISNKKNNFHIINENDKNSFNSKKAYDEVLSRFKKKIDVVNCSVYNYGFNQFVNQLETIDLLIDK
jgi:hypothetical protein